ncbi:MAG TPA: hypothetical protein VG797_09540 [Phycisphaerales bacterium]|nr:hypothetical protein [Phycisphaerales bacterium]
MKRNLLVRGLILCAAHGAISGMASGSIHGFVSGQADVPGPDPAIHETQSSDESAFFIDAAVLNAIGGDGLALQGVDFRGGRFVGRAHSCVGPPDPFRDTAFGSSELTISNETFAVVAEGPNPPQTTAVTFCYSYTTSILGSALAPSLADNSIAGNQITMTVNNVTRLNGSHQVNARTGVITGSGAFNGTTDEIVTVEGEFTINVQVGVFFPVSIIAISSTTAGSRSAPGTPQDVEATSGFALTFGAHTAEGFHVQWRGEAWSGLCGSSVDLVPPNPADEPAPSALVTLCITGAAIMTRRRR